MAPSIFVLPGIVESGIGGLIVTLSTMVPVGESPSIRKSLSATPPVNRPVSVAPPPKDGGDKESCGKSLYERVKDHLLDLKEVSTNAPQPLISPATAQLAREAWWLLWEATGQALPVPAACTGPDGQMLYTWDRDRHHLELE